MRRLTYDFVKEYFEKEGCTLTSSEYKNATTKLNYICQNGHSHSISYDSFRSGHRCPVCFGNAKPTLPYIRDQLEKEDYVLLSTKYKNSDTHLDYMCPNGHRHSITWHNWQSGKRCPYCAGLVKPTVDFIKSEFEKEGYTLLSTEYINNRAGLDYICPKGHKYVISWHSWLRGARCSYCAGNIKIDFKYIRNAFEKEDYVLLTTEYANNKSKLAYICPFGHKHSISWHEWGSGRRCPTCAIINKSGDKHYNWKGGISFEPYCEVWKDKEFKQDIRDRDWNKCLNPYCDSKVSKDLTIHHIDYDKKNCHPKNLITVCRSCNARANTNRDWHKSWYRAILTKRYGFSY